MKCCPRFFCCATPYDSIYCPSHTNQYFAVWSARLWAHSSVSPSRLDSCRCPHQQYADRRQENLCFFKWTCTGNDLQMRWCDLWSVRDEPPIKLSDGMNFRLVIVCYFLLFQPPNIKYGVISTSSLGEKVLSANHGDPSRQTSGSEQASSKSNPAEGTFPLNFSQVCYLDKEGCRKSMQWFRVGFANQL